jgi:hypothetical protein
MSESTRPCEICGQPIDPERVEAIPETRLCGEHARAVEKYGGEFIRTTTVERTSKQGSLKRNYGSASITKTRNHDAVRKLRAAYLEEQEQKKD